MNVCGANLASDPAEIAENTNGDGKMCAAEMEATGGSKDWCSGNEDQMIGIWCQMLGLISLNVFSVYQIMSGCSPIKSSGGILVVAKYVRPSSMIAQIIWRQKSGLKY